jgi:hypothetical protein
MVKGMLIVRTRSMDVIRRMRMKCGGGTPLIATAEPASPRVDERNRTIS